MFGGRSYRYTMWEQWMTTRWKKKDDNDTSWADL